MLRFGSRSFRTTAGVCDEYKFVTCPAFAESISEGDLRWEKKVGDSVAEDEVTLVFSSHCFLFRHREPLLFFQTRSIKVEMLSFR